MTDTKRVPMSIRIERTKEVFPTVVTLEWYQAFSEDIELFGRIIRDIIKAEQTQKGRSGPRPPIDRVEGMKRLRQYMGVDYSELPFIEAFRILTRGKSGRLVATEVGLDRNMVRRLMAGERQPDMWTLEQIAKTYGKKPSYFMEYRLAYIFGALETRMSPELTVDLYRKLSSHGD